MKRLKVDGKLNKDNRGVTLVEVVVSLLIIAIIFIPLLMTFVQASRVNSATNTKTYANAAGENIMEAVKAKGIEDFALWYYEEKGKPSDFRYAAFDELSGKVKFVKSPGDYVYEFTDEIQGTKKYNIKVKISPANYKNLTNEEEEAPALFNDYTFADFSAFSSDKTVLIFPKTDDTIYQPKAMPAVSATPTPKIYPGFDDKAVSYFMDLNQDYVEDKYIKKKLEIENYNDEVRRHNKLDSGEEGFELWTPKPLPVREQCRTARTIRSNVTRNIVVEVSKNRVTDDTLGRIDGHGYVINSYIVYTAYSTDTPFYAEETPHIVYQGYCTDVYVDELESLFLLYTAPEEGKQFKAGTDITVKSTADIDFDCYIAVQVNRDKTDETYVYPGLTVSNEPGNGHTITYYSQSELNVGAGITPEKGLIKDMAEASNRIFEITVDIYEGGTDASGKPDFTNLLSTIRSTYVNDTEIK